MRNNIFIHLQAHRVVLASVSEYFRAMFADHMKESRQQDVSMDGITGRGIRLLINYAYTASIELNLENIIDVLSAANYVQMDAVVDECSNYLQTQIDIDNCVDLITIAETFSLKKLQRQCYRFICLHLQEFAATNEMNRLDCEQLQRLLTCDFPVNCTETTVLQIILNWLKTKQSDRKTATCLLRHVHLAKISLIDLKRTIVEVCSMTTHQMYHELIHQLTETQQKMHKNPTLVSHGKSLINSRGMELVLINVGGFRSSSGITNEIAYYLPSMKKWQHLTSIPHIEQCNYGTSVLDNELYVVGGCYNVCLKEYIHPFGFRYNPVSNRWATIKPMAQDRCRFSLNTLNQCLYAVGGVSEHDDEDLTDASGGDISNVEVYDPSIDSWKYSTSIPEKRSQHAGAAHNQFLYISGGLDRQRVLASLWRYDPKKDVWQALPDMLRPRADHSMFGIDNKIYVCGGWTEETTTEHRNPVESIDAFDIETNSWHTVTTIPTPKYHAGCIAICNRIYIVGGLLSHSMFNRASSTVEYFDIETKKWALLDPYPQNTWECTCVALYIPKGKDTVDLMKKNNQANDDSFKI